MSAEKDALEMRKFRKRPVTIEAALVEHVGDAAEITAWCGGAEVSWEARQFMDGEKAIAITTLEGTMYADFGDWVIKGVAGEFYPCKPEIFASTYEAVCACCGTTDLIVSAYCSYCTTHSHGKGDS